MIDRGGTDMKKQAFILGALLLAATWSCTREQDTDLSQKMTFQAVWADNPDTRTAIQPDGTSVWWSPNEEINVFGTDYSSGKFTSTNTTPQATATFEGTLSDGSGGRSATRYIGVYPYSPSNDYYDGEVWLEVKAFQPGKEGTFADKAFPAVSITDDKQMTFYHVCGGARFSVVNEGIGSVTFESLGKEPLAGYVRIQFEEDGTFVTEVSEYEYSTAVTVTAPEGGFVPGKYYFAAFLPGTLSQGLNVTYSKLDGSFAEIALDKSITVHRARFGTIAGKDAGLAFRGYDITTPTAIDLGLSVKWASFNLGATKPEEPGYYYAWGETEPKKVYGWGTYKWGDDERHLKKYNHEAPSGTVDNKVQLDPEDDAAHVKLGDKWRMPVHAELQELLDTQNDSRYEWNFKSVNGVDGVEITCLANGNHIFLPKNGFLYGTEQLRADQAKIWSSSLLVDNPMLARNLSVSISESYILPSISNGNRESGNGIRPVYGDLPAAIPVESISLERSQLSIYPGLQFNLAAKALPENATNKIITWSSSDESVVTVDTWGSITAVALGTATITAATVDGNKTATCQVTVKDPVTTLATPAAVDLGLSVKWASFNLGATRPEESGNYYSWGETEPKTEFGFDTYKWFDPYSDELTKYNNDSEYGLVDDLYLLEADDDVAHVKLGGDWRMPTAAEMQELLDTRYNGGYEWQYKSVNGIPGFEIVCLANHNSIFLPFSGNISYEDLSRGASYWTTSISDYSPMSAKAGDITAYDSFGPGGSYYSSLTGKDRSSGVPVRPVYGRLITIPVESVTLDRTKMDLSADITFSLSATVQPQNATNQRISWTSSDESVATVDSEGNVHCVAPGTATITVTTADGGKTASCFVTVKDPSAPFATPTAVDLGLSIPWASFNVGASSPEENGFYYAWGETEPKSQYDESTYQWCDGSMDLLTKYNFDPASGVVDYRSKLEDADDVAHVKLGGKWRMPTYEEIQELYQTKDNPGYQWTWKTLESGCSGVEITCLANGNHIFLPASGYVSAYRESYYNGVTGFYWSSSVDKSLDPGQALQFHYDDDSGSLFSYIGSQYRPGGYSVRPVHGDPPASIPVESISLDRENATIPLGASIELNASILPENTTETIIWTSNDESVATVQVQRGLVTSVAPGTATITVKTLDGKKKATCQITVQAPATTFTTPMAVDLGLSVKWGSFNLGATAPEQPGNYYAWGETEPKSSHPDSYQWYRSDNGYSGGYTKYCNDPDQGYDGFTDGKTRLDPEDDVVRVKLGGKWRMPTEDEVRELVERCTWTWTRQNGMNGFQVKGTNGNSIFLPAAGSLVGNALEEYNDKGYCFTTQMADNAVFMARTLEFGTWYNESYFHYVSDDFRQWGVTLRPVCE